MALNYKKTFMVIGNRLVQEHGFTPVEWDPTAAVPNPPKRTAMPRTTVPLQIIAEFFNQHPEAQQLLHELGGEWPMPDDPSKKPEAEVKGVEDMTEQEFKERNDAPWES